MSYFCYTCDRYFDSCHALSQHEQTSSAHVEYDYECETCDRMFATQAAANQHMNAMGHWEPEYECETCDATFRSEQSRDRHMEAKGHWAHYCRPCGRRFVSANSLAMHMNSSVHRGRSISCPTCKKAFVSASGLSHHLERGACPNASQLNRQTIYDLIATRDSSRVITNPSRQIEWTVDQSRAWNGEGYECYLCHRVFGEAGALNRHVNGTAHQQPRYYCPNRACRKEFGSLAAMFGHLESETCGFCRFESVNRSVHGFLDRRQRLIAFN